MIWQGFFGHLEITAFSVSHDSEKQSVEGKYVHRGPNRIGFEVGAYDATRPLVIDPVLSYAAYFGGSGFDVGRDIAVDPDGRTYLTGATDSEDFPIKNPL